MNSEASGMGWKDNQKHNLESLKLLAIADPQ